MTQANPAANFMDSAISNEVNCIIYFNILNIHSDFH